MDSSYDASSGSPVRFWNSQNQETRVSSESTPQTGKIPADKSTQFRQVINEMGKFINEMGKDVPDLQSSITPNPQKGHVRTAFVAHRQNIAPMTYQSRAEGLLQRMGINPAKLADGKGLEFDIKSLKNYGFDDAETQLLKNPSDLGSRLGRDASEKIFSRIEGKILQKESRAKSRNSVKQGNTQSTTESTTDELRKRPLPELPSRPDRPESSKLPDELPDPPSEFAPQTPLHGPAPQDPSARQKQILAHIRAKNSDSTNKSDQQIIGSLVIHKEDGSESFESDGMRRLLANPSGYREVMGRDKTERAFAEIEKEIGLVRAPHDSLSRNKSGTSENLNESSWVNSKNSSENSGPSRSFSIGKARKARENSASIKQQPTEVVGRQSRSSSSAATKLPAKLTEKISDISKNAKSIANPKEAAKYIDEQLSFLAAGLANVPDTEFANVEAGIKVSVGEMLSEPDIAKQLSPADSMKILKRLGNIGKTALAIQEKSRGKVSDQDLIGALNEMDRKVAKHRDNPVKLEHRFDEALSSLSLLLSRLEPEQRQENIQYIQGHAKAQLNESSLSTNQKKNFEKRINGLDIEAGRQAALTKKDPAIQDLQQLSVGEAFTRLSKAKGLQKEALLTALKTSYSQVMSDAFASTPESRLLDDRNPFSDAYNQLSSHIQMSIFYTDGEPHSLKTAENRVNTFVKIAEMSLADGDIATANAIHGALGNAAVSRMKKKFDQKTTDQLQTLEEKLDRKNMATLNKDGKVPYLGEYKTQLEIDAKAGTGRFRGLGLTRDECKQIVEEEVKSKHQSVAISSGPPSAQIMQARREGRRIDLHNTAHSVKNVDVEDLERKNAESLEKITRWKQNDEQGNIGLIKDAEGKIADRDRKIAKKLESDEGLKESGETEIINYDNLFYQRSLEIAPRE